MKATKPTKKSQPAEPDQPVTPSDALNFTANAVIDIEAAAAAKARCAAAAVPDGRLHRRRRCGSPAGGIR